MRILFTGASSFTGYWFVKTLAEAGHEVVAPLRSAIASYTGVRRMRVDALASHAQLIDGVSFGDSTFIELAGEGWDLLCHHAADVTNYKSPNFDVHAALASNTHRLPEVLEAFQGGGGRHLLLTGSVFEAGEGRGTNLDLPFSPYGLSKGLTYELTQFYCARSDAVLGKFVIPNPFGPLEEPRFTQYLIRSWSEGRVATVSTPDYIRDNIHVSLLALAYREFAERFAQSPCSLRYNPSGYRESQGAFAKRFAREMEERLPFSCALDLAKQREFPEPLERVNTEPVAGLSWNEPAAWDELATYYEREMLYA